MRRIMLTVAYDGTNYCGWQIQPTGITIEEVLNQALSHLLREEIHVLGVSRTDSGVHALGNLCVFDTETRIPAEKICYAVNQGLPGDIVVQKSEEVPLGYHPRKCNSEKTYEYVIYNNRLPNPVERLYSYFFYMPLDVDKMKQAAVYLVGEHDFKSFCSARTQVENTVRTITALSVERDSRERHRFPLQHGAHHCRNADSCRNRILETGACEGDSGGKEPAEGWTQGPSGRPDAAGDPPGAGSMGTAAGTNIAVRQPEERPCGV